MKKKVLVLLVLFLFFHSLVLAERIYLKNGESIHGTITNIDGDILTVDSDLGYGIVKISKKDVVSIGFPFEPINLTRRYAIGYVNRAQNSIGSADQYNYRTEQFSLKTFLVEDVFLQYIIGYGQISVQQQDSTTQEVSSFTSGIRIAKILFRRLNSHVYGGVSAGIVSIKDTQQGFEEVGTDLGILFGGEIFIGTLPNFGISAEIELTRFATDSVERSDLNISAFPTFSVHYYF